MGERERERESLFSFSGDALTPMKVQVSQLCLFSSSASSMIGDMGELGEFFHTL